MMWFLLLLLHSFTHFQPITLQDDFRLLLRSKQGPCEGHVEVMYNNQSGYVGDKYWDRNTEEVVCRSTHCGTPVENSTINIRRSMKRQVWLNELKCNGNETNLWDCPAWPGPGVSFYQKPTVKRIKCSNKIKIELKPHRCEGAVRYSIEGNHEGFICSDDFSEDDAALLCKNLNCGNFKKMLKPDWVTDSNFHVSKKMMIKCKGLKNVTDLWQCAHQESSCKSAASISCEGHNKLQLRGNQSNVCSGQLEKLKNNKWKPFGFKTNDTDKWCNQMHCGTFSVSNGTNAHRHLTCSDSVKVVLRNNMENKCYGEVKINVNGIEHPVCASVWKQKEAEMVCSELNCGIVIKHSTRSGSGRGIMDHVECEGNESSLWHCGAKHGTIRCSSVPYVVCSGSMDVKLVGGPGKCAGKLVVQDEGRWKQALSVSWTQKHSDFICEKINCGNKSRSDTLKFEKGEGDFLKMKCSSQNNIADISECIDSNQDIPRGDSTLPLAITCEEHKVVFLSDSCSGAVGIEQGDRTYWLSGSSETWNQEAANAVCSQTLCGEASNFTSDPYNDTTPAWGGTLSCSFNHKSLFECNTTAPASDSNETVARVKCTGKVEMRLSNVCWGHLKVSAAGTDGNVCSDTWTHLMSNELCQDQGCGAENLAAQSQLRSNAVFRSFHSRRNETSLSKYGLNLMEGGDKCNQNPVYVVCKGSVKPKFVTSRDKCSGNIGMIFEGKWLPVASESLKDPTTRNTICRQLDCGDALNVTDYFGPPPAENRVIKASCSSQDFESCQLSVEKPTNQIYGGLQCAEWRKMVLEVDYACKGDVTIYSKDTSEDKRFVVSSRGWTDALGQKLCENMNCGKFKLRKEFPLEDGEAFWNGTFNCSSDAQSIWDCEKKTSQSLEGNKKVYIQCEDEPKVTLSQNCNGELKINNVHVCDSRWNIDYSHRVCQELNCGNALDVRMNNPTVSPRQNYHHVQCDEHNYIIGQCKRVLGKCQKLVSISCTESVKFNMSEKCGGLVKISYKNNQYEGLCDAKLSDNLSTSLCQWIGCGPLNYMKTVTNRVSKVNLVASLECPNIQGRNYKDPRHCVKQSTCETVKQALYCQGYQPVEKPPPVVGPDPVPAIVGVGFALILVILIVIFVRYRILRRKRKSRVSSDMQPGQEAEWESGEYEDVDKSDEIEDFNLDKSEFIREKDVESNVSFSYDDIDEVTEAHPLTPPGSTEATPSQKGLLNPNDDGVTYEVDDTRDSYDDIDASLEVTQTKAEVHDGPKATPESDTKAPQNPEQKDEDYLVPGQDG